MISSLTSEFRFLRPRSSPLHLNGVATRGFNIVKAFIELGTYNTIESLQALCVKRARTRNPPHSRYSFPSSTNTHVPAPPWAAVAPITIPILTCNAAADLLIEWFGPDDLKYIVGGHKWWQVRGLDGVDAEWITEREFLRDLDEEMVPERKLRWEEETVLRMEHMDAVMVCFFFTLKHLF